MVVGRPASPIDVDCAGDAIVRDDSAEAVAAGGFQLRTAANLHLLQRIAIAIDRVLDVAVLVAFLADAGDVLETADGGALVDQIGGRQIAQPEELPPLGLVLTAMPVDQIRQQPMWMLRVVRLRSRRRAHRATAVRAPTADGLRDRRPRRWPHRSSPPDGRCRCPASTTAVRNCSSQSRNDAADRQSSRL